MSRATGMLRRIRFISRYPVSSKRFRACFQIEYREFKAYFSEFVASNLFAGGYHPLRHPDQYKSALLYILCRSSRPDVVVETGVASGVSSAGVLLALARNGKGQLHSIDLPNATYRTDGGQTWTDSLPEAMVGRFVPQSLRIRWSLKLGPSRSLLPTLVDSLSKIDVFYHDSEHTKSNLSFELTEAWRRLRPGGYVIADNIDWNEAFSRFCDVMSIEPFLIFPAVGLARKRGAADSLSGANRVCG